MTSTNSTGQDSGRVAAVPFDPGALGAWLVGHLPGYSRLQSVDKFAGGQSNPTYLLETDAGRFVMRAKPGPVAQLLPSAHAVEREYKVISALAPTPVPVPRTYCLCEDESVIGRAFYVMEWLDGRVLWDQSLPETTPAGRRAIYDEMNRVIAALHSVDYKAVGLGDFGRSEGYFARQISRWTKQYRASETDAVEAMDRLMEWLPVNIPPNDECSVVHGDFRLDNVMFHRDRPEIIGVLDWELSTLGHPLGDFSYHCLSWHLGTDMRGLADADIAALGIPTEAEYVRRYCERTGRTVEDVTAHWDFYLAYNLFRLAAILQGIVKRALSGTASNPKALENRHKVAPLAQAGWAAAQKRS